jgi:uncharacterized protein (TIGR01244 family)
MGRKFRAYNFVQATERIATSGVVPLEELPTIAAAGYRSVVNLLPDDNQYAQAGEADAVRGLGMAYVHIPIDIDHPTLAEYERFEQAMDEAGDAPVWVHCAANFRVSAFMALYGERRLGWSRARADELVGGLWEPTAPWREIAEQVRAGKAGEMGEPEKAEKAAKAEKKEGGQ